MDRAHRLDRWFARSAHRLDRWFARSVVAPVKLDGCALPGKSKGLSPLLSRALPRV